MDELPIEKNAQEEDKSKLIPDSISSFISDKNDSLLDTIISKGFLTKPAMLTSFCFFLFLIVDGLEMILMHILIIPIKAYFNLSEFETQLLSSSLFLGVAIGSFSCGFLCRSVGRTSVVKMASFFLLISHIMMSISVRYAMFFVFRLIIGFSLGILLPSLINIFSEYLPIKFRGFGLTAVWTFFCIGTLLECIIVYCHMPNLEMSKLKSTLLIFSIFPSISFIFHFLFIFDSPRSLVIKKEYEKAFEIITQINHGVKLTEEEKTKIINEINSKSNKSSKALIRELFEPQYLKTTLISIFLFFINACTFYGLYVTISLTEQELNIDDDITDNKKIIRTQMIIAGVSVLSNLIGGALTEVNIIGRKGVIWTWMLITGIFCIFVCNFPRLFTAFTTVVIFSCQIYGNVLITYIVEIYPTKLRDVSSGFILMTFRLSGFISQFLYLGLFNINYKVDFYLNAILCILGVVSIFFLPFESANKPLDIDYSRSEEKELFKEK